MTNEHIANGLLTSWSTQEKSLQCSPMFGFPGLSTESSRLIG